MSAFRATRVLGMLAAALVCLAPFGAHAAITCSIISVTPVLTTYDPSLDSVVTGGWSLACNRISSDPTTFDWELGANNGVNTGPGNQPRVNLASDFIDYDLYRGTNHTGAQRWADTSSPLRRFTGTINFGASLTAAVSGSFDLVVRSGQAGHPSGAYSDAVIVTLRDSVGGPIGVPAILSVTVVNLPICQITVPPGNVNFSYTSFQVAPAAASTNFGVQCTSSLPYAISLDAISGTLLGLDYTLSLSAISSIGTGFTQTHAINGSIAGGQAGSCATAVCSGSDTRTLTITY